MSDTRTQPKLRGAVVGTGHLGRHHTRILNQHPEIDFLGAFDADRAQLEAICTEYGATPLPSQDAVQDAELVVVATPTIAHHQVASALLDAGCHVMVEKPITQTMEEAEELIALAEAKSRILAVGHVEFYNPAVQASIREAGPVRYLESQRLSPFTARSVDVDVILDLMIHDLQITLAVAGETPSDIRAVGVNVLTDKVDLCHAWVEFPSGLVANLTASRVSAERIRKLRLFAEDSYYSIDYAEQSVQSAKLQRLAEGPKIQPHHIEVKPEEPLLAELNAFIRACRGEETPLVDGRTGADALAAAIVIRESVEGR